MSRQLTHLILVLSLLALVVVCYFAYGRKTPQVRPAPVAPPSKVATAPTMPTEAVEATEVAAVPLPPRNGQLSQLDQIRWSMHDNVKVMVAISKQRLQREEQLRTQDPEAQRLFNAGPAERDAYLARIRSDSQIQDFDTRSAQLHDRQRTWADMCQKLQKGTATP